LLKETVKAGKVLSIDETTVQVMREKERKSRLGGGMPRKPVVIFTYSSSRKAETIDEFIQGYRGYLQRGGYAGYDSAVKGSGDSIPVGWFAHGRRKVFEGQKNGGKAKSAAIGINYIKQLTMNWGKS
jgi:hypothetical protein